MHVHGQHPPSGKRPKEERETKRDLEREIRKKDRVARESVRMRKRMEERESGAGRRPAMASSDPQEERYEGGERKKDEREKRKRREREKEGEI